uniref:Uncharacterized protein n=1 Tax=Arundo donax TaxID=35708 RepID=A0A0A9HG63_ARUDO
MHVVVCFMTTKKKIFKWTGAHFSL